MGGGPHTRGPALKAMTPPPLPKWNPGCATVDTWSAPCTLQTETLREDRGSKQKITKSWSSFMGHATYSHPAFMCHCRKRLPEPRSLNIECSRVPSHGRWGAVTSPEFSFCLDQSRGELSAARCLCPRREGRPDSGSQSSRCPPPFGRRFGAVPTSPRPLNASKNW